MPTTLERIQAWYLSQCDDTWERSHGVQVRTDDGPGWQVAIDLAGTRWAGRDFEPRQSDASEHDWMRCWVDGAVFHAAAGPCSLDDALAIFLEWVGADDDPVPRGTQVDEWLRARWQERMALSDDEGEPA
jgi:hypothetical protein